MDLVSLQDQIKQCNEKIKELEAKLTPKKESGFNL
jgi:cell division septum initiation protein DivIVA